MPQEDANKSITHILEYQKLIRVGGPRGRGEILPDYKARKVLASYEISDNAKNEFI